MEGVDLGRTFGGEADRHAVARRRLTVTRPQDQEGGLVAAVNNGAVAERPKVLHAERRQRRVIECDGPGQIACAHTGM